MRFLPAILLCLLAATGSAASTQDPGTLAREILARQDKELTDAALAWLKTADLTPLAAAKLGPDPRESERLAAVEAKQVNELLDMLRGLKKKIDAGDPNAPSLLRDWFRSLRPNEPIVARMMASRAH